MMCMAQLAHQSLGNEVGMLHFPPSFIQREFIGFILKVAETY